MWITIGSSWWESDKEVFGLNWWKLNDFDLSDWENEAHECMLLSGTKEDPIQAKTWDATSHSTIYAIHVMLIRKQYIRPWIPHRVLFMNLHSRPNVQSADGEIFHQTLMCTYPTLYPIWCIWHIYYAWYIYWTVSVHSATDKNMYMNFVWHNVIPRFCA